MKLERSKAHLEKANRYIPLGAQTLSKTASQFTQKYAPNFVKRGEGAYLYDIDGNKWVDYIAALGPILLGYNNIEVNNAIIEQLKDGMCFSLSHELEAVLAEKICQIVPGVEKVRFGKNGSDVTSAAIRASRAITGREHIAICGYHGWQDWYIGTTARNMGVPEAVKALSHTFQYNQIESLKQIFDANPGKVACVIMESIGVNEPVDGFLQKVKDLAHANGALLVFDEIVNGFRLRPGGGGQYYGVVPDFTVFGKAMGNGAPIAAIGGSTKHMEIFEKIFFSFTFAGDCLGIAASLKTIEVMEREKGYDKLFRLGQYMKDGFNRLVQKHGLTDFMVMKGLPHHPVVEFKGEQSTSLLYKSYFQQESLRRGVLFLGPHFCTLAHTIEILDSTLAVYDTVMELFAKAHKAGNMADLLEAPAVQPVFRARV